MPNQSKPKTDSKSSHPKTIEEALARFQMEHHAAGKDGKANYGTYTTLAGGLNAVQPATHLGLSHTQTFEHIVVGEKVVTVLKTRLLFTGEDRDYDTVIESNLPFPDLVPNRGNIMQALGSAITYARRYSLLAIYGLAGDDDDAEGSAPTAAPAKKEIARSPQRGANARQAKPSPVAHEMVTGKVAQASIPQSQKDALANELKTLPPHGRNRVISAFRQEYNISSEKISEFITTPEHLSFIKSKIAEVESDSP
tara:strand:- start:62 stop:820 length:759 start_codon:yes stop_codon:yes gene_type:complete